MRLARRFFYAPDTGAAGGADGAGGTTAPQGGAGDGPSLQDIMGGAGDGAEPSGGTDDKGKQKGESGGAGSATPAWMQQLPEDMRSEKELAKFSSLKELAGAYKELAGKQGGTVTPPAADAKPEEVQAFFEALGKPKTADGYGIKGSSEEGVRLFKQLAFDANLTDAQAQAVYAALEKQGADAVAEHKAALQRQYAETDGALHKEFGAKYGEKMELLKRGMISYCTPAMRQKMQQAGLTFDPDFVHLFLRLGELGAEGAPVGRAAGGGTYRSVAEGGTIKFEHLDQLK